MGIVGLLILIILLVYVILPAAGGPGPYAPRYGWGGPSIVGVLLIVLVVCLVFRVLPVVWY